MDVIAGYITEIKAPGGEWIMYAATKELSCTLELDLLQSLTGSTGKTFCFRVKAVAKKGSGYDDSGFSREKIFTFPPEDKNIPSDDDLPKKPVTSEPGTLDIPLEVRVAQDEPLSLTRESDDKENR